MLEMPIRILLQLQRFTLCVATGKVRSFSIFDGASPEHFNVWALQLIRWLKQTMVVSSCLPNFDAFCYIFLLALIGFAYYGCI